MEKFWIVTRNPAEVASNNPVNADYSKEDAIKKAEALCRKTGHRFYILEAIQYCEQKPPVEWKSVDTAATDEGCSPNCGCWDKGRSVSELQSLQSKRDDPTIETWDDYYWSSDPDDY